MWPQAANRPPPTPNDKRSLEKSARTPHHGGEGALTDLIIWGCPTSLPVHMPGFLSMSGSVPGLKLSGPEARAVWDRLLPFHARFTHTGCRPDF